MGDESPSPRCSPDPSSIAGFIYTSGTTGKPKGVMLTHDNLTSNIHAGTTVFPVSPEDRTLSFLPWAHVYGQAIELHLLVSVGASTAFVSELPKLVEELADVRPTMLVAVPRIFNRIYASVNKELAEKPSFVRSLVRTALRAASRKHKGEHVSPLDSLALRIADPLVFAKVRAKFGGRLKYAHQRERRAEPRGRRVHRRARHRGLRGLRPHRDVADRERELSPARASSGASASRCPA